MLSRQRHKGIAMNRIFITISFFIFRSGLGYAQDTVKVMFYNLLNWPTTQNVNTTGGRIVQLNAIVDEVAPDLFMVCELGSEQAAEIILDEALQTPDSRYAAAPFVVNQSSDLDQLQQLVFYNTHKLVLNNGATLQNDLITTNLRDINRYSFTLNAMDAGSDPIYLEVFVAHLKAGNPALDPDDAIQREQEVRALTDHLNANASFYQDRYVLFAGDFNLYTSQEAAYQEIIDANNDNAIDFIDPVDTPGDWHTNSTFRAIHTQSTLTSNGHFQDDKGDPDGATGGLDDRFDFIMISENLQGDSTLEYVENSYISFGNNGNCYNQSINDIDCTGTYDSVLRDHLFNMSDHLPVVMSLQTDRQLLHAGDSSLSLPLVFLRSNKVSEELVLSIATGSLPSITVSIFDITGKQLQHRKIEGTSEARFNVIGYPTGLYLMRVSGPTLTSTLKFMKI